MTSICTIVRGRSRHLHHLVDGVRRLDPRPSELVVVWMGADQPVGTIDAGRIPAVESVVGVPAGGRLPLARARNRAVDMASSEQIVLLDVDCIPGPDVVADYSRILSAHDAALVSGGVRYLERAVTGRDRFADLISASALHPDRPHLVPGEAIPAPHALFWSVSFAIRRRTWDRIGGFDDAYDGYGAEDTDFAMSAAAAGVPHVMTGDALAFHQCHEQHDPPVQHVDSIVTNAHRYRAKWGAWPMEGWLREFHRLGLVCFRPEEDLLERRTAEPHHRRRPAPVPGR